VSPHRHRLSTRSVRPLLTCCLAVLLITLLALLVTASALASDGNNGSPWQSPLPQTSGITAAPSDASADTTPPSTIAIGADALWHNAAVQVALTATDNPGGSGVTSITYSVDGGSSTTVTAATTDATMAALPDHSNDGIHTLSFYATDNAGNAEAPQTVSVQIDTTPPTTTASGADTRWHNKPVTLIFTATDSLRGSGVAATYYTLDDGAPQTYTAPFMLYDGTHTVTSWSLDWAGNLETKHTGYVNIDTGRPICRALGNSSARPGIVARLAYRIDDPPPSCGKASVAITIYRGHKPVKRIRIAHVLVNRNLAYAFTGGLRTGTYTWVVAATDIAGNEAKSVSARLVVPDRYVEKAINWALAQRGSHGWDNMCLAFVCDAYQHAGVTPQRRSSATVAANALRASSNKGVPPRGAWVFYRHAPWGHAALSLGDGRIVHDFGSQGVIVSNYRRIGFPYVGWAVPKTAPQVSL
jgi:hypothetical protein